MSYSVNNTVAITPTGSFMAYLGSSDPDGWIICNGVVRINGADGRYNGLLTLNIGSGTTSNYTPPNLQAMFLRGTGTNGSYSGPALNAQQTDTFKSHSHTLSNTFSFRGDAAGGGSAPTTGWNATPSSTSNTGGTETRPVNIGVYWIIKL